MNWRVFVKGKVWKSDCGMVIENQTSNTHGIRKPCFQLFKNQNGYDKGSCIDSAISLGKIKKLAQLHV